MKAKMAIFSIICFGLLIAPLQLLGGEGQPTAQNQVSFVVACLGILVFMKFLVIGVLGYLWHRNSKYKKQKIILDI